jgi:hypothetical protein
MTQEEKLLSTIPFTIHSEIQDLALLLILGVGLGLFKLLKRGKND